MTPETSHMGGNTLISGKPSKSKPDTPEPPEGARPAPWRPAAGRRLGAALNYRALQHAPVNEQGVVLLFGMAAEELGFLVETVESGFPDCEGKRLAVDGSWRRVRIEFEFRSRAFRDHGHDPCGCDMIVCWIHDWRDCPLDVLELSSVLAASPGLLPSGKECAEEGRAYRPGGNQSEAVTRTSPPPSRGRVREGGMVATNES